MIFHAALFVLEPSGKLASPRSLRGLDWFEVSNIRGHIDGGQIAHFQVELRVGFKLERQ